MLLGLLPPSPSTHDNRNPSLPSTVPPSAHTQSQGAHDPIAASGIPNNSNGGARKTKVSTGTLGSPFNQQNNPSGLPASAHATAIANAANAKAPTRQESGSTTTRDRDAKKDKAIRDAVAAQQKAQQQHQHQRKTSKQSQQYAFPQTSTANSSQTALPTNVKNGHIAKAAPGSARKAPPPVSGTNNPLNASLTNSANGSVGPNGLRRRTSSSASDRSLKKDDLLDRLAQALKWVSRFVTFTVIVYEADGTLLNV